ncbi:DUF7289 family protein [Haloarcula marina]|uniref:DUF7289 family protein n=1 Tax=Haloarcula marina TaxID=2961574 RepID=UPI0020B7B5AD|nr:hypothetical protein [Halomicroarcula marina]
MSERAVSEVLSFILVFSLIVGSIALVSVSGLGTLEDAKNAEQLENAERAFDVLSDNVADLHKRGAPSRATEMSLGDAQLRTGDNVTVNVSVYRDDGDDAPENTTVTKIRPLVYEGNQDRTLTYEAGAVFRQNPDGGLVVSGPPLVANGDRMLVNVVALNSPNIESLGGTTVLVRANRRSSNATVRDTTGQVKRVNVTFTDTGRSTLWAQYFESEGFVCDDPAGNEVECSFGLNTGTNIDRVYVVVHDIAVAIDR